MVHWAIPANAINSKVDNSCSILPAVMYEIIMCSENWFENECTSFILKTFWEHYITVWVETCSKTVWFSYSDSLHWKMTSPRETQTCLVYGMNLELRLQTSNSFFILLFSFSITTLLTKIIWKIAPTFTEFLKKFITLYRVFLFFAHECVIADSLGINMSIVLDSLMFLFIHVYFVNVCMYQTSSDLINIPFIWFKLQLRINFVAGIFLEF